MPKKKLIAKAKAISNANISFVSLVYKAANKHKFLITKAEDGKASFQTFGKILKTDSETHYVTGIVYEPMIEDTQGNYMTEEEITKAAYGYVKNGMNADMQHNFEPLDGATVVESYVTKCEEEINGQTVQKGTWVMTMEITDDSLFESIEKGDITGFSMGGVGQYDTEDVDLTANAEDPVQKKNIFKSFAKFMGFDVVEKGAVMDDYKERSRSDNFWTAFYALQDALFTWNWREDRRMYETDPEKVQEALTDFNAIVTDLLTSEDVTKSVDGIAKAGKKMSNANKETLTSIHESLGNFLAKFDEIEEEEIEVTKAEITEIVKSAIAESMAAPAQDPVQKEVKPTVKKAEQPEAPEEKITKADIQGMIDAAIRKATGEEEEEPEVQEGTDMDAAIAKAVQAAMEPFMKQAGVPTNLNNSNVQKSDEPDQHYLHGII